MCGYDNISFVPICYCKSASTYSLFVNSQYCDSLSCCVVSCCIVSMVQNSEQISIRSANTTCIYMVIICAHFHFSWHFYDFSCHGGCGVTFDGLAWIVDVFFLRLLLCTHLNTHKNNNAIVPNVCAGPTFVWAVGFFEFKTEKKKYKKNRKKKNKTINKTKKCVLLVFQSFPKPNRSVFNWLLTITIFSSNCFKLPRSTR